MSKKVHDLTGQTFGRLTVVDRADKNDHKKAHWNCICICGNKTVVTGNNLLKGNSTSCGCYNIEQIHKKGKNKKEDSGACKLYHAYKCSANERKLTFSIQLEDFKNLTSSRCHYCGIEPYRVVKSLIAKVPYLYNGLDRINNAIGYTLENCVPACYVCNRAKHVMSYDAFMAWLCRVSTFNASKFFMQPKEN